ncbi:MAG: DUF5017 domain-containing protein [Paludibacteraceae bacterium]
MKKNILYTFLLFGLLISCQTENVEVPEFQVSVDSTTYFIGDTVFFKLNGNSDLLLFYSGESGNAYEYANQDRIVAATASATFQTQNRSQSYTGADAGALYCQENQLKVKISTDFSGKYDSASIKNATWVDLTDKFSIGPVTCNSTSSYIAAGTVDLTNYLEDEKPFYFAFQYVNLPNKDHGNCNIWRFSSFGLTAVSDAGSATIATQTSALWTPVFMGPNWDHTRGYSTTSTAVTMRADPAFRDINQELWCISDTLKLDKNINVGQDKAVGIKSLVDVPLTTYTHTFNKAGTYTVTFVAANSNIYGRKETVKQIEITVLPK